MEQWIFTHKRDDGCIQDNERASEYKYKNHVIISGDVDDGNKRIAGTVSRACQ